MSWRRNLKLNFRIEIDSDEIGERGREQFTRLCRLHQVFGRALCRGVHPARAVFSSVALRLSIGWKEETRLMVEKPIWSLFTLQIKSLGLD